MTGPGDGVRRGDPRPFRGFPIPEAQCACNALAAEEGGTGGKPGPERAQAKRTALSRSILKAVPMDDLALRTLQRPVELENRIYRRTQHRILKLLA